MKKKVLFVFIVLAAITLTACGKAKKPPYSLSAGTYTFEKATITYSTTNEIIEKSFDDIYDATEDEYLRWRWLFNFSFSIENDTEFFFKDNRCFVLYGGLAYEVIARDTLKLHFPNWLDGKNGNCDIVIVLCYRISYE